MAENKLNKRVITPSDSKLDNLKDEYLKNFYINEKTILSLKNFNTLFIEWLNYFENDNINKFKWSIKSNYFEEKKMFDNFFKRNKLNMKFFKINRTSNKELFFSEDFKLKLFKIFHKFYFDNYNKHNDIKDKEEILNKNIDKKLKDNYIIVLESKLEYRFEEQEESYRKKKENSKSLIIGFLEGELDCQNLEKLEKKYF